MKILFIDAGVGTAGLNSAKENEYGSNAINHGLSMIAAYAQNHGFDEISLINLRELKNWYDFEKRFLEAGPDVVGISIWSVDFETAMNCISMMKKLKSNTVIVAGGIHPTLETDETERNENIDFIIRGWGEISFTKLLKNIREKKPVPRIIQGEKPGNINDLPFAFRELYDYKKIVNMSPDYALFKPPCVDMIVSRGCPYNCSFCQPAERMLYGGWYRRSVKNVIEELVILREKYHFKSVYFTDDTFILDRKWVLEFCREYRENGFSQPFSCSSRANIICSNEDLVEKLAGAGMKQCSVGFESGSQKVLNFLRKGTTVEQNLNAARILQKYGVRIFGSFMLGIPTETEDDMKKTVELINEIGKGGNFFRSVSWYTPTPGSDLYTYCREKNLTLVKNHEFNRNPFSPKIRGIDYGKVYKYWSMANNDSLAKRVVRWVPYQLSMRGCSLGFDLYRKIRR